jgi:tetratricopeptide (TPR) repeat protein
VPLRACRASFAVLALLRLLAAQEFEPQELLALRARGDGDPRQAAHLLLEQARLAAAASVDPAQAARIEAWATLGSRFARLLADREALAHLDALASSPAARSQPLLADRLALCALELAETLPGTGAGARAEALGFLRGGLLLGPFANERGAGFAGELGPERTVDPDAALPGKRRDVRWRRLPLRTTSPAVPLAAIVHPLQQTLVFVAHAVIADAPTAAVLELGSTGAFEVWCNGERLASRTVERPFQYDQDAVVLPLRAGPNLLVHKLGHLDGAAFAWAARLRSRDGAPLAGIRVDDDPAAIRAAAAVRGTAAAGEAPALGGRSTWEIGAVGGADALRLAWLWRARDADGDRDRRDTAAARHATAVLPGLPDAWLAYAAALLRHGRSAADSDENERRRALQQALRCEPDHVEALVALGRLLRDSSQLWRQARELAAQALARNPRHLGARWLHAATLHDEGLPTAADAALLAAAMAGDTPEAWRVAADLLTASEPRQAMAFHRRVLAASTAESDLLAMLRLAQRLPGEAAWPDPDPLPGQPYARSLHLFRTELLLAEGQPQQALAVLERWLELAPDDAEAMTAAARCWRARRDDEPAAIDQQLHWLRSALAVEPNRRDDERYAGFVAAAAAGPAAGADAGFHAPWAVDAAAVVAADPGPPADAATANDPLHWLLRQQVVRANGNGTTNVYTHDIVRVLTTEGARALLTWQVHHFPGEQRARLLGCTIFRADGTRQRPALQGARVRLPDLRPGDVVAIEGRVDDQQPTFFGDYFGLVHRFAAADGSPVRRSELVVIAAPGRTYRWQASNGAPEPEHETLPDGTQRFRFAMHDLPRDRPELRRPRAVEREPVVRMTTYRDWDEFAGWWWNLIQRQLETTPAMRATVRELCDPLPTLDAKIRALYHFVTTDVRYEAWEFGVHGYKPYSTGVIHERRHGDCKDKALLLCALLAELGVACHPVLIFADPLRSQDDLTLPLVEQFNHCIAWLPPQHGLPGRFLDGTATWHPIDTLPEMDQGATVLIVDRGRAELRTVPWTTPEQNADRQQFVVRLATDGSALLQHERTPIGNAAVPLREALATEPARTREVVERDLARTFGKVELRALEPGDASDPEAPVRLLATAFLPELGQRRGRAWQLPSAFADEPLLALAADGERQAPLLLGAPRAEQRTLRYELPPGYRVGELPAAVAREAPFGSFAMRWRADPDAVVVERTLHLRASRIEPGDYQQFRDFVSSIKTADGQLVLLQQEGGR